ncbi:putative DNA helicase ino80, partial [Coemansia sp. RSA 2681]
YNYGMPAGQQQQTAHQSHRSRHAAAYEYDYEQAGYDPAQYAGGSGHRYQYHDQHQPAAEAAAHDEYYSRQYAYASQHGYAQDPVAAGYVQHASGGGGGGGGASDAAYYDRHAHHYPPQQQQQQQYDYRQGAGDHRSDALRSPSAQVQAPQSRHKYAAHADAAQYDYGAHDADPQRAAEPYEHDRAYNLDAHLSRQQAKARAFRYGASEPAAYAYERAGEADYYRSPPQGAHMQVFRREARGYAYADDAAAAAAERSDAAYRPSGIGITALLADAPSAAAAYERRRPHDEPRAVMSISQLVGSGHAYGQPPPEPAEPIVVPSDDDDADAADDAAARAAAPASDDGSGSGGGRPLAARPNRAIRPRPSTAEAEALSPAKRQRAAAPGSSGSAAQQQRRPARRVRGAKKVELSREYVSDDDDDEDDEEEDGAGAGARDVAVPSADFGVDEHVQAYMHHVQRRTDRAVAKYEAQARRKAQRMHEHVVQRYGPYLRGYLQGADGARQPPPMGYFSPPSRAQSARLRSPDSDDSAPLALLAGEKPPIGRSLWARLAVEHVPPAFHHLQASAQVRSANMQAVAQLCQREAVRVFAPPPPRSAAASSAMPVPRPPKELQVRARRNMREMLLFWKRYEREERDLRKRAEKEAAERL